MARRIKQVNNLSKQQLINKIINQANSLNKKIKTFNDEGVGEFKSYISNYIDRDYHSKSGRITKSKKVLGGKSDLELKRLLSSLIEINNNEVYGTIGKYKKAVSNKIQNAKDTFRDYLLDKGYNENEVELVINSGSFLNTVAQALNHDKDSGHSSGDTMEKVFLEYTTSLNEEERQRAMSNLEFGMNNADELLERLETERRYLEDLHNARRQR